MTKKLSRLLFLISWVFFLAFLPQKAGAEELTIVNPHKDHADLVYKGWKVEVGSETENLVADLNKKTSTELDKDYELAFEKTLPAGTNELNVTLKPGTYYVRELSQRSLKSQPLLFTLMDSAQKITIYTKDEEVPGKVEMTKLGYDSTSDKTGTKLAGVTFYLYRDGTTEPLRVDFSGKVTTDTRDGQTLTTDKNGQIKVTGLLPGKYYFVEQSTLSGYKKNTDKQSFTVKTGQTTTLTVKNYKSPVPSKPITPSTPSTPSKPSTPTTPSTPTKPSKPVPSKPQKPSVPSLPEQIKKYLPQTGEAKTKMALVGLLLIAMAVYLIAFDRKRRKKKE